MLCIDVFAALKLSNFLRRFNEKNFFVVDTAFESNRMIIIIIIVLLRIDDYFILVCLVNYVNEQI